MNRYIEAYGHRTFTYEVADGPFAEAPHLFIGLIAAQLERNFDPGAADARLEAGRQEALHEVRETLSSSPPPTGNVGNKLSSGRPERTRCGRTTPSTRSAHRSRCCGTRHSKSDTASRDGRRSRVRPIASS